MWVALFFLFLLAHALELVAGVAHLGNLDGETQDEIMAIFRQLADAGKCVILVSHSPQVAKMCDQCYELKRVGRKK